MTEIIQEEFYIGQIFEGEYPPEAAIWCNDQGTCHIEEVANDDSTLRFQIVKNAKPTALELELKFNNEFIEIPDVGFYRKTPKGYSSAIESINTAFNAAAVIGKLPAGYLTFYQKPDFTDETQCTEEWLVEHSFKNEEMPADEFGHLYSKFVQAWNTQEHL